MGKDEDKRNEEKKLSTHGKKEGFACPRAWNKVVVTTFIPIKGVPRTMMVKAVFPISKYSGSALKIPRSCSLKSVITSKPKIPKIVVAASDNFTASLSV